MVISRKGVMLISKQGIVLRTQFSEIRETGRNTQGVKLMNLEDGDEVAGIAIMNDDDATSDQIATGESIAAEQNGNQ